MLAHKYTKSLAHCNRQEYICPTINRDSVGYSLIQHTRPVVVYAQLRLPYMTRSGLDNHDHGYRTNKRGGCFTPHAVGFF